MPTESTRTRMDDHMKEKVDSKRTKLKTKRSKQLQTNNLPTDDVENINSSNKGRYLLLFKKTRIILLETERMLQRIQRRRSFTSHRSAHSEQEQEQTEKSINCLD